MASAITHKDQEFGQQRPTEAGVLMQTGLLIINADDWGRNRETTDRTLECTRRKAVTSVSAMVFMEDSERAAELAQADGLDVGLHLNFTTPFETRNCPPQAKRQQEELGAFLRRHPMCRLFYHPGLKQSFAYVVAAQLDEFQRVYGRSPDRIDGHHHMHLCSNVLRGNLLPEGIVMRRNFTFFPGESNSLKRLYRRVADRRLARHYRLTDYFFNLVPMSSERLERIFSLSREHVVEVETHPVNPSEHRFLTSEDFLRRTRDLPLAPFRTFLNPCSSQLYCPPADAPLQRSRN